MKEVQRGFRCHRCESTSVRVDFVESLEWGDPRPAVLALSPLLNEAGQCTASARVAKE